MLLALRFDSASLDGSTISGADSVPKKNLVPSQNQFQEIQRKTYGLKKIINHMV